MIKVTSPTIIGDEFDYLEKAIKNSDLSGAVLYNTKCQDLLEKNLFSLKDRIANVDVWKKNKT
jgi:hypothetical protein